MTTSLWAKKYDSLQRALRIGQKSLAKETVYVYRVGSTYFRAAFALFLAQPEGNWLNLLQEALRLFALSADTDDCQSEYDYPFNLARLYVEWYLGQWLLGAQPDPSLLDQSINLYVDGLWEQEQQPLSALSVLPMGYLLRQDSEHLQAFWQMLAQRTDLSRLPAELALWHKWSELFLMMPESTFVASDGYVQAYADYRRQLTDPTTQSVKFYLAAAKIGLQSFGLTDTRRVVISRLAVEPWQNKKC